MTRYILDPHGRTHVRDDEPVDLLLTLHGETEKAFLVSPTGFAPDAVWVPKALSMKGDPCGGFQLMDRNCQRLLITIYEFSMPAFKAIEKGLLQRQAAPAPRPTHRASKPQPAASLNAPRGGPDEPTFQL